MFNAIMGNWQNLFTKFITFINARNVESITKTKWANI